MNRVGRGFTPAESLHTGAFEIYGIHDIINLKSEKNIRQEYPYAK